MRITFCFLLLVNLSTFSQVKVDDLLDNYSASYNYIRIALDKSKIELKEGESVGFCWDSQPNPSIRDGFVTDTTLLTQVELRSSTLSSNSRYYFRLFLLTPAKTIYGHSIEILTAPSPDDIEIGDVYQGGIVSHFFLKGQEGYVEGEKHGIIVTEKDIAEAQWGCFSVHTGTNTQKEIGFGRRNTDKIIAFHEFDLMDYPSFPEQCDASSDGSIAAYICDTLHWNGFDDWFLPSLVEMYTIRLNLHEKGKGNLLSTPTVYWSSTEEKPKLWFLKRGSIYAYAVRMNSNIIGIGTRKNTKAKIRAVRYF